MIYTEAKFARSIANIVKIKINENAKRPAFSNALPEANHNEMIGYARESGPFAFIYSSPAWSGSSDASAARVKPARR